ncbi:DMT family transporter [Paraburkholderia agricolaris]|uniref:DMT family transporter n=1 Tax=Paraburkholderia agricolaris TaxID=2152888 RepID=UPI00129126A6|nr:DMT family transporter [Paraburkholderia agricolaris]
MRVGNDGKRSVLYACSGVLVLSADTLLVRLVGPVDPLQIAFWRGVLMFAASVAACSCFARGKTLLANSIKQRLFWMASLCYGTASLFFVYALRLTDAASVLFIISAAPLFATLLSRVVLNERTPAATWLAMLVALGGIGLVQHGSINAVQTSGNAMALASALAMSAAFVVSRKSAANMALAPAAGGLLSACAVLPLLDRVGFVEASQWHYMGIEAAVVVPIAFGLIGWSTRFLAAPQLSLILLLETVLGPVWIWLVLGERPSAFCLIGGAVVLSALAFNISMLASRSSLAPRRRRAGGDTSHGVAIQAGGARQDCD